uniref:RING-type E3 ubiquitin transferase n=1 Tax=Branchiostoma floridae TaxID=7739 RepID=C3YLZ2_BRAFL|eukprot:XP_002602574.1 hypothetical protein BRAFLDRAFT_81834 [Branchiostoma floridae]
MATAAPSSLRAQIREELTCSICLELFTRPKVLPCQHTFCQGCLQHHAGGGVRFMCPNCRRQVRLQRQEVKSLPDNLIAASLCERLQYQNTPSGDAREQPQDRDRCQSHPHEEVQLFCKQCDEPVCNECLDEGHSDHVTISLKRASQERKPPVQALLDEGRRILETYCSFLKSLREKEESLNEQKRLTDNSIIQAHKQAAQELAENRVHLLSAVEENQGKNNEELQKKRDEVLAGISRLSTACDQAEQEMERGGVGFHSQEAILTEVIGTYQQKEAPSTTQSQSAVFKPINTSVQVLGHVMFQPAPISDHHQEKIISFGRLGSTTATVSTPLGVTVSDEREIYVADLGIKKIQVFTLQGTFVRQFPMIELCGQGMESVDVAMGRLGVWVVGVTCLKIANFAVHYSKDGRVLRKFHLQQAGCQRGVAVDTRMNHILITQTIVEDWGRARGEVIVLGSDGTLVRTVDGKAPGSGWLSSLFWQQRMKRLMYISVDGEGRILVSDWDNHCVFVYDDFGKFLFKFGGEGSGEGKLKHPYGSGTDSSGNIIVADSGNNRVELFDITGRFKHITTNIEHPGGVAMAPQGQLVVTCCKNHTVHIVPSSMIYSSQC